MSGYWLISDKKVIGNFYHSMKIDKKVGKIWHPVIFYEIAGHFLYTTNTSIKGDKGHFVPLINSYKGYL